MLTNVSIPVAELANLKPVHCTVLAGLLAFADRAGRCWPCLRKLVEITGLTLSRVHRAIAEMEEAGILTRTRRGAGTLYQLAERFLWRPIRPKAVERPGPDCSASGTVSPASGTKGESKKESEEEDSKRGEGSVRRAAPPPHQDYDATLIIPAKRDKKAEKEQQIKQISSVTLSDAENEEVVPNLAQATERPAQPAPGPNLFARQQWLKTLNAFIGERLRGPQQWAGWELVSKAEKGALIDRAEQRTLDDIDRAMRGCGYRAVPEGRQHRGRR